MRTLKLTLAYDGTDYVGWQRQANGVSIQQRVEEAFAPFSRDTPSAPTVVGAGRTDAGAHALGQVASITTAIDVAASAVQRALNARLPADVRVVGAVDAPPGFHARYHAGSKIYRYRIITTPVLSPFDRRYAWHVPWGIDYDAFQAAATVLVGTHDFAAYQAARSAIRQTVRTVHRCDVRVTPQDVTIEVEGDGFLRHMVRTMVGTLVDVASGRQPLASVATSLAGQDRRLVGQTAPAAGLTLVAVRYPSVC